MNKAVISILIPCKNQGIFLTDCLNSIIATKLTVPIEIIVVDDGSDEDIETICRPFKQVKYIRQERLGVSAARNRLLKEAVGEYIAFLDADDLFVANKLQLQLEYLRKHPDCPYVGCNVMSFYGTIPQEPYLKNEPGEKFLIPCLFRKEVFTKTGPFDESLVTSEDTEYLIRMSQNKITGSHYLDEVLYLRRLKQETKLPYDKTKDLHDLASSIIKARKNKQPLVSLIVPCFNAKPYIEDFLLSVINQSYRPIQLILVDDGSTDGTVQTINDYLPTIKKAGIDINFLPCKHNGQASALNEGLKYCQGKYLTWADCDDLLYPENIAEKVLFLENHPEIDIVRNKAEILKDGHKQPITTEIETKEIEDIFEAIIQEKISSLAGCFMMRFSLFLQCWPQKQIMVSPLGQNLQLILPAVGRSLCGYIPKILLTYRIHDDSHSRHYRTTREVLERIEELRLVLNEGIKHSGRDIKKYNNKVEEHCNMLRQSLFRTLKNYHKKEGK